MLSRRDMVGKLAAGTAAVLAVGAAQSTLASTRRDKSAPVGAKPGEAPVASAPQAAAGEVGVSPTSPKVVDSGAAATLTTPAPWEVIHPLTLGATVAHGWRVAGLSGVVDGSFVLTLENERGRTHRVHICRNDGRPQGLVYTNRFDLLVMNGGQGDLQTEENFGQAVMEVAHVLAANERRQDAVVTALLPHEERLRMYEGPAGSRLR